MVACEGTSESGEPRICFCFNRQVRGCSDTDMKVSKKSREKLIELIQDGLIW